MQTDQDLHVRGYPNDLNHVDKTRVHKIERYFVNKWICIFDNYRVCNDGHMEVLPRILEAAS